MNGRFTQVLSAGCAHLRCCGEATSRPWSPARTGRWAHVLPFRMVLGPPLGLSRQSLSTQSARACVCCPLGFQRRTVPHAVRRTLMLRHS
jgi:hypothetical protein